MLRTALALILLSSPAFAAELSKADVDKIAATYMEKFNAQDAAGIATLFTKDGVHVNQTGFRNVADTTARRSRLASTSWKPSPIRSIR